MLRRHVPSALIASAVAAAVTVPRNAQAQTTCVPPCYPQTVDESNAGVVPTNYTYPPLDVLRYGADPTGGNPSDAAMASAIAVCGAKGQNGGVILLPAGTYSFKNQIDISSQYGITLRGVGRETGGAAPGTQISFSGSGSAPFINLLGAAGCRIEGMQIDVLESSFTGPMIQVGQLSGAGGEVNSVADILFNASIYCSHLALDTAVEFFAERCSFENGAVSVTGQSNAGGSFSNVVTFKNCQWSKCQLAPVLFGGQSWLFDTCTFEPLASGNAGAFNNGLTVSQEGVTFMNCWFGDANTAGVWVNLRGNGLIFHGNRVARGAIGVQLNAFSGFSIKGNSFYNIQTAVNFAEALCDAGDISANYIDSTVTELYGNVANVGTKVVSNPNSVLEACNAAEPREDGFEISPNGIIRQWGTVVGAVSGGNAVSFPKQFPGAQWNIQVTLAAHVNSGATIYAQDASVSGFTAVINDPGAASDSFYWSAIGE